MASANHIIAICAEPNWKAELQAECARQGMTMSQVVRGAIGAWMDRCKREREEAQTKAAQ